jgi:hypothetical protein
MKIDGLKKLIKEAVREAIQDELKDILLEAVRTPKTIVKETYTPAYQPSAGTTAIEPSPSINHTFKRNLRDMVSGEFGTISATSANTQPAYTPPPINTVGEGTSLPAGEVSLNQIMGLMK